MSLKNKKNFNKTCLSIKDQVSLLQSRGLKFHNLTEANRCLTTVSYYRLSAYFKIFQIPGDPTHNFKKDVFFEDIWSLYVFDRHLRLIVSDAIERIEIALRTSMINALSLRYGNLWYLEPAVFSNKWSNQNDQATNKSTAQQFLKSEVEDICRKKNEDFIRHYYDNYSSPVYPPSWMLMECLSFGKITSMFLYLRDPTDIKDICKPFGYNYNIIKTFLEPIRFTRNLCAHHSRLWNRKFLYRSKRLKEFGDTNTDNYFREQAIMLHMLNNAISPNSKWREKLKDLFQEYSSIVPFQQMGFNNDWQNDEFWTL